MAAEEEPCYDFVGIGFGPAHLALSIALRESQQSQIIDSFIFLEKKPEFGWHSSLLLPGSNLQVSPLKDLASMRDPTSSYTFYNYLHQQGRLAAYINRERSIPTRREWTAYLTWAAKRMEDVVSYGQEIISVSPVLVSPNGINTVVDCLRVAKRHIQTGEVTTILARSISVGVGGIPRIPKPFQAWYRDSKSQQLQAIVHSSTYLPSLAALSSTFKEREAARLLQGTPSSSWNHTTERDTPKTLQFAVIGGGQSSGEMCLHLRKTFPDSTVKLILRASALVPSDDSAFVNAVAFDPDRTDVFWKAHEAERKAWLAEYRRTNYSVMRSDLLNELNDSLYDQLLDNELPRSDEKQTFPQAGLEILASTEVQEVSVNADGLVQLKLAPTKILEDSVTVSFDAVFLGTGFDRHARAINFLDPLRDCFPLLDDQASAKKAALGFVDEVDSASYLKEVGISCDDECAIEQLRRRTRGISRDYRLVSYWSDAFDSCYSVARRELEVNSSKFTDTLNNSEDAPATPSSQSSDETMLATPPEMENKEIDFRASLFFLGGNEDTHGLADSLLSIVAHRAGEIVETLQAKQKSIKSQKIYDAKCAVVA